MPLISCHQVAALTIQLLDTDPLLAFLFRRLSDCLPDRPVLMISGRVRGMLSEADLQAQIPTECIYVTSGVYAKFCGPRSPGKRERS